MNLQEDDITFFQRLHQFIYLDAPFTYRHCYQHRFKHYESFHKYLRKLEEKNYIRIFKNQLIPGQGRGSILTLGAEGLKLIQEVEGERQFSIHWSRELQIWYRHSILIAHVAFSFEERAPEYGLLVKDYVQENRGYYQFGQSKKQDVIRPDGFLIVGPKGQATNFGLFLEMERSRGTKKVLQDKIERYTRFLERKDQQDKYLYHIGAEAEVQEFLVLFVGASENTTQLTKQKLGSLKPQKGERPGILHPDIVIPVLLTTLAAIIQDPFQTIYFPMHKTNPEEKTGIAI
ncbi:replication-relaxation family protein [Listeria valentina]|uniref:replication-relaxation family protein n=1 Tax=Listeria valentina TaxID=2705293 RepID=UPI001430D324|nr:replication-relaxation family protein [Listeria valentina]